MSMVTLAAFIVVTQDALPTDDVSQPILELVRGWGDRLRYSPDHDLDKGVYCDDDSPAKQQNCFHVGEDTNTSGRCQELQQVLAWAITSARFRGEESQWANSTTLGRRIVPGLALGDRRGLVVAQPPVGPDETVTGLAQILLEQRQKRRKGRRGTRTLAGSAPGCQTGQGQPIGALRPARR